MNKILIIKKNYLLCIIMFVFTQCKNTDCKDFPVYFTSYKEAKSIIEKTDFLFTDNVNTSKSSWIKDANYYSCDKKNGLFLLKTEDEEYIYNNLPIDVWYEFKKSVSFGKYYNVHIKDKFQLILKNSN